MSERLAEARDILTRNYEDMHALIAGLRDEDMDKVTANGWPVRQVAGHVATSVDGQLFVLGRLRSGKSASLPAFLMPLVDVRNWLRGRKFKSASRDDILAIHEEKHNELFATMNTLTEEELDKRGPALSMGDLSVIEYLRRSPEHEQEHAGDIRKAIGA